MGSKQNKIQHSSIYLPSEKIVARDIEGEMLIIPIEEGLADLNDEMFSLNETGLAIWKRLNKNNTVELICKDIAEEFDATFDEIRDDITAFLNVMLEKNIIFEYLPG